MNTALEIARNEIRKLKDSSKYEAERKLREDLQTKVVVNQDKTKDLAIKLEQMKIQNSTLISDINNLEKESSILRRENYNLNLRIEEQNDIVSRIEGKFKQIETSNSEELLQMQSKLEDAQNELRVRSSVLDSKNKEVEQLRVKISAKENEIIREKQKRDDLAREYNLLEQKLESERSKLQDKIDKRTKLLDDYEAQIEDQQMEAETLKSQNQTYKDHLKQKSDAIDECFQELKKLGEAKKSIELELNKKEAANNHLREQIIREIELKNARIAELENGIFEIKVAYEDSIKKLENRNKELLKDNKEKEEEIRTLIVEFEGQKKKFKDNIAKFQDMFH